MASSNNSGDSNLMPITGHKLNGNNYLQWSHSVMMFICGRGNGDYLKGVATKPSQDDEKFKIWNSENNMVMSWLINSMTNEIGENFLLYRIARKIWEAAKETYSNNENTPELFEVESVLHDFRQGDLTVTQYFNTLNRYWQQMNLFEEHNWGCLDDGIRYRQIIEQKRIYKFLIGLNKNIDEVRGRILGSKPLLNIWEAFSEVRREESRKKIMMGSQELMTSLESSALVVRGNSYNTNDTKPKKGHPWCDHCCRPGHTRDTCWKIHGKPADWKSSRSANDKEGRGNFVSMDEKPSLEPTPFSKE
ncbi:uncharacterized protein LOC120152380 [Hibiscus syriacus]|uniref:uncharacterized protein LOC120152380 n=1 Tax=Hibiscus syriacus TaxID=106335 RepID=UPI001921EE3A|nr:uncharacterized protein LOC120152380 [Hibiscus syriacus]